MKFIKRPPARTSPYPLKIDQTLISCKKATDDVSQGALPFRRPEWEYVVEKRLSIQLVRGDHCQFFCSYQVEERYKGSFCMKKSYR